VNRALELPKVEQVSVWGCGNFELGLPSRLFRNRRALREGRLNIHGWAERQALATARKFACMLRADWRERFVAFTNVLAGKHMYITIDLDCLDAQNAITNWEPGLFEASDIVWAISQVRRSAIVVGGDLCGAWSEPAYERPIQRLLANRDHPRIDPSMLERARATNLASLHQLWPALTGCSDVLPGSVARPTVYNSAGA
jgi:hypothetical protein